jgi:hypothetical protein
MESVGQFQWRGVDLPNRTVGWKFFAALVLLPFPEF